MKIKLKMSVVIYCIYICLTPNIFYCNRTIFLNHKSNQIEDHVDIEIGGIIDLKEEGEWN